MNRNVGETIIRYIGGKPKGRIDLASGSTPEGYPYCWINTRKKTR